MLKLIFDLSRNSVFRIDNAVLGYIPLRLWIEETKIISNIAVELISHQHRFNSTTGYLADNVVLLKTVLNQIFNKIYVLGDHVFFPHHITLPESSTNLKTYSILVSQRCIRNDDYTKKKETGKSEYVVTLWHDDLVSAAGQTNHDSPW